MQRTDSALRLNVRLQAGGMHVAAPEFYNAIASFEPGRKGPVEVDGKGRR